MSAGDATYLLVVASLLREGLYAEAVAPYDTLDLALALAAVRTRVLTV